MVIVKLIGGLGNQLFQYAVGRSISIKRKVPLKLDLSAFDNYKLHSYSLHHFNIVENIASAQELARFHPTRLNRLLNSTAKLAHLPDYFRFTTVVESKFSYQPQVLEERGNLLLEGYWQSEKYFADTADLIRKEFTVNVEPDPVNKRTAEIIRDTNSVSLHIRRGDYVSNPEIRKIYAECTLEYYGRAVSKLMNAVINPHFFVFSDDVEWARKNFKIDYPVTFVTNNSAVKNYEDLRLMSLCKNHIIANSSFSWWGAWLGANSTKLVIAPRQWFQTQEHDTSDLLPKTWLVV